MIRTHRRSPIPRAAATLLGLALLPAACGGGDETLDSAAARGKALYDNVCIACHNGDPAKDGSLGPAVAGASAELLRAKVIEGRYPPGYTPRRPSAAMPRYEYLADGIDDLAAYLATVEPAGG